jgi:eukaryotic-like serine/threonine-protein kinase
VLARQQMDATILDMAKALDPGQAGVDAPEQRASARSSGEQPLAREQARPALQDADPLVGTELAAGRFKLLRVLGRGGMGVVYEAQDGARDQRVALKRLINFASSRGLALKFEFRSLAEVEHPNVVRLHELFCDEHPWFFTMDLVQGVDFVRYVRNEDQRVSTMETVLAADQAPTPITSKRLIVPELYRLRDVLVKLIRGINAIHAAGKLHCDLKPSNIIVSEQGELQLLDFGFVTDIDAVSTEPLVVGTPGYIAPERYRGAPASIESDWYSVGVILHEALTGALPLTGQSIVGRDFAVCEQGGLAAKLSAVCKALLAEDPGDRWAGERVLVELGFDNVVAESPSSPVSGTGLVGRERELGRLHQALRAAEAGTPSFVCVSGESGIGKSALLARFIAEARLDPNTLVLSSRCYEREAVRYKTLDGVIDQLAIYWSRLPTAEAASILPRGVESLVQVFSVLGQVPTVQSMASQGGNRAPDPGERRLVAFSALRELISRICDRVRLVLVVDDMQWGDGESAHEILNLLSGAQAPALLFVGAYRSSDVSEQSSLTQFLNAVRASALAHDELSIGPLSESDAVSLAQSLSNRSLVPALLAQIASDSQGSPFFVSELVRQSNRKTLAPHVLAKDLVRSRIEELSIAERTLLELVSISPGPVKERLVQETAAVGDAFELALQSLLSKGLVRRRRGEAFDLLEPYHDRIGATCASALSDAARYDRHAAYAGVLLKRSDAPHEVVAVHLEKSGQLALAAEHYALAAGHAHEGLAFEHSADLRTKSIELRSRDEPIREPLPFIELAKSSGFAGHGPRAAAAYLEAATRSEGAPQDELRLRAAEQLLYAGHQEQGMALLERSLPRFGIRVPRGPRWMQQLLTIWNAIRVGLRRERTVSAESPALAHRAAICDTLGDATLYVDFWLFVHFQQQHVLAALRGGDPYRVALAFTARALMLASPFPLRFASLSSDLQRARNIAADCKDPYLRGRILLNHAVVYSAIGRYAETDAYAREAESIFRRECQGMLWGLQHAIAWRSVSMFYLGQLRQLGEFCRDNLPAARRRGDNMLSKLLGVWKSWVDIACGRAADAIESAPELVEGRAFAVIDAAVLTQRGPLLIFLSRVDEAWDLYRRCEPRVKAVGIMNARVRANEFYWTRGLTASHLLKRGAGEEVARVLRGDIKKLRKSGLPDAAASALHLEGNYFFVRGDRLNAAEKWAAAARQYAACEMSAFEATLRLAAGQLGERVNSSAESERARTALKQCGVLEPDGWVALWCLESA